GSRSSLRRLWHRGRIAAGHLSAQLGKGIVLTRKEFVPASLSVCSGSRTSPASRGTIVFPRTVRTLVLAKLDSQLAVTITTYGTRDEGAGTTARRGRRRSDARRAHSQRPRSSSAGADRVLRRAGLPG